MMTADVLFHDYCGGKTCTGDHVPLALVAGYEASLPDLPDDDEIAAANDEAEIRRALATAEVDRLFAEMTRARLELLDQQSGGRGGF